MKHFLHILLGILLFLSVRVSAQTPYDSFSPETTRPMVMREALCPDVVPTAFASLDTIPCVAVIDLQRNTLLLVNLRDNSTIGTAPLTDGLQKWLSVDPLVDKYIFNSPYMYCNGNPIKYVDPNGKWFETAWDIVNVMMDAASLVSNVQNGNTKDAAMDGVGLVLDVAAAIVPFVPGGAGTAIKTIRTADKLSDVSHIGKQGQKVKGIGNYIQPNGGNAKPHGGAKHNGAIDKYIDNLPAEARSVRKNQTQVDIKDKKVGTNRPDVQYNLDGTHYNVEFDNDASRSIEHQKVIENNDPNSQTVLILLD